MRRTQHECTNTATITITVPVTFLGDLHTELPEGAIKTVIGQFYFSENLSSDCQAKLGSLGYNPDDFKIQIEDVKNILIIFL